MGTRISSANQLLLGRSNIQFNGAGGRQPYIEFMLIGLGHSQLPPAFVHVVRAGSGK
jgi:hypothetical protein